MDEIEETEIFIIEMEIEFQDIMEDWKKTDEKKPDWWLIALGAQDAPRPVYDKSLIIYKNFKKFCFVTGNHNFDEAVGLFTLQMLRGE